MKPFVAALCILVPAFAVAQGKGSGRDFDRAEVFGGYSFLSVDGNGTSRESFNGWEASGALNLLRRLAVEADLSGYYKGLGTVQGVDVNAHDYLFAAGPRLNWKPLFLHSLIGVDHATASTSGPASTVSVSQNAFAAVLGGGIEWNLSRHWAIRPSVDYVLTRHGIPTAVTQNDIRLGVGLAYGFGR